MKNSQIERWALEVIERVEAHQPIEDTRVELKAKWPDDPAKAARRIAGHANAAQGERILWLIGLDEETGVSGAEYTEMTEWLPRISVQFDSLVPQCHHLNVPTGKGKTVAAFVFETDRAPYVVKNPAFGSTKGEGVKFEVPWRDGTQIRSATRSDLIRIFSNTEALQSLLRELEYNLEVGKLYGSHEGQYRDQEFIKAISKDALSVLSEETGRSLYQAHIGISKAQGCVTRLIGCTTMMEKADASHDVVNSRLAALPLIQAALDELRLYLGK
jgi:hypothetical protein